MFLFRKFVVLSIYLSVFGNEVYMYDSHSTIDVSDFLQGDGNPWVLTQEDLENAVSNINKTRKTVFFPAGVYYSNKPIVLDFAAVLPNTDENINLLRSGVRFIGENFASVIQMGTFRNQTNPSFWIKYTGHGVFSYEFSGLTFIGDTDHTLLHMDNTWNSCVMKLVVNNEFKGDDTEDSPRGNAIGLHISRALQSDISIVSRCAKGTAVRLRSCEFSTFSGSFSNSLSDVQSADGASQVTSNSVGLWMRDCMSNTFLAVDLDTTFYGIVLDWMTWGNVFNSVIDVSGDSRGAIFAPQSETKIDGPHNTCEFLNTRESTQGGPTYPPTFASVKVSEFKPINMDSIGIKNEIKT